MEGISGTVFAESRLVIFGFMKQCDFKMGLKMCNFFPPILQVHYILS